MKTFRESLENLDYELSPFESTLTETLSVEKTMVDGRLVNSTVIKVDDSFHRYDGLRASDFFIENQLDAGTMLNREVRFSLSKSEIVSRIENQLNKSLNSITNE